MYTAGPFLAVIALALAGTGSAQTALVQDSPFLPPGTADGGSGPAAAPAYELAGGSVSSQGAQVCIYDVNGRRSHWIGVGDADGRIEVVSYDAAADRAVVRIAGVEQTLELRKEAPKTGPASRLPFVAATNFVPNAPPPGLSLEENRKQREARMMVSDLMDIGMRQRRAHEEALRQAGQSGQ